MPAHDHILTIHQKRAQESLRKLLEAYLAGEITHESDLLARLTDEYASLYAHLTEPTIIPEPMRVEGLLRLSALRRPMAQLDSDLELAYEQIERLEAAVTQTSNICAVERFGLEELLSLARDRITESRAWTSDSNPTFKWASETFKSLSKVNQDASSAWIDTRLGVATLAVIGQARLEDRVSRVDIRHVGPDAKEVDGLPGNWLELASDAGRQVLSEIQEPIAVTYVNQTHKPSSNPVAMFDNDSSSWFEWEKYLVPKQQRLSPRGETAWVVARGTTGEIKEVFGPNGITMDYGWEYIIHWPRSDSTEDAPHWIVSPVDWTGSAQQALKLFIEIEFDSPQELSWIELLPYLVGTEVYYISSAQVSPDGVNEWTELLSKDREGRVYPIYLRPDINQPIDAAHEGIPVKDHRGVAIIPCRLPLVKGIRLELTQSEPYETVIAHKYFLKTSITQKTKSSWFGLSKKSSSSTRKFRVPEPTLNPAASSGGNFLGWGSRSITAETDIDTYYDLLAAHRYCIGIRDLGLLKRTYAESSRVISRAHRFATPVSAASIIVSENIPDAWDSSRRWITYELSHDGTNWQSMSPQNTEGTAEGVIHFPPTRELYLRATFTRPADRLTETPLLEYYAIKAIPEA